MEIIKYNNKICYLIKKEGDILHVLYGTSPVALYWSEFHQNYGNVTIKTTLARTIFRYQINGLLHRENGPADVIITNYLDGHSAVNEDYYWLGLKHNANGPASIYTITEKNSTDVSKAYSLYGFPFNEKAWQENKHKSKEEIEAIFANIQDGFI